MTQRDMAGEAVAGVAWIGRAVLLAGLVIWTLSFAAAPLGAAANSILHLPNLVFHEAGHPIFSLLGRFMSVLGGSLLQLAVPIILAVAFVRKANHFAAAVCGWWAGENLLDLAPYHRDGLAAPGSDSGPGRTSGGAGGDVRGAAVGRADPLAPARRHRALTFLHSVRTELWKTQAQPSARGRDHDRFQGREGRCHSARSRARHSEKAREVAMPIANHVTPKPGDAMLLVGTMKGAFILRGEKDRRRWDVGGPYFPGSAVYAMAYDARGGRHRIWAGPNSMHWGGLLRSSDDFGETWTNPEEANVKFPESSGAALKQIWQIVPGRDGEADTLYCGVEPAAVFTSRDAGATWTLNEGLWNHPQRSQWQPGGGGLCLHTILLDPAEPGRVRVAVSTGGMYVTEDAGVTWRPSNKGVRAVFLPDKYPEFGQCVHKVVQSTQQPDRMFLQNHWGLYRSDDRGESWTDIANGVPSDFGFPVVMHPRDPDCAWIVPLESDEFRCTPEGKLRVYRTRDAGASWQAMTAGLPQESAYETVLRDAMAADALDPAGVYFGTRNGKLFASADEGERWSEIADGLPPVISVKAVIV